jgi:uncharacterized repeat protein (TIGR01451 family)
MDMKKLLRSSFILALMALTLASCAWFQTTDPAAVALATPTLAPTTIELTVQTNATTLTAVGQVIKYTFTVKNTGAAAVAGPITVTGAVCPEVNTVGNKDVSFDAGESLACTSEYTITQVDLDRGSIASVATATVSGINSNAVTTTVSKPPPTVLNLTKTANPTIYTQTGQVITYTYVIMNSGSAALGPAQFTVTDTGIPTPINCGDASISLAPTATLSCTANYTITQADMDAGSVATNATASGGGVAASPPASATLTKASAASVPSGNTNLTVGSTVQHKVVKGEWLWQIARCYGADPAKTLQANPQLTDPGFISPNTTVTVPNIGSAGKVFGPPCVGTHTVQAGDTWNSIALIYNADPFILQIVNKNSMAIGQLLTVPLNSAGTLTSTTK